MVLFLTTLFVGFAILIVAGVPLSFSLFFSSGFAMLVASDLPMILMMQQLYKGIDAFPILAIPVFFLAGDLMNKGKVSEYLIDLCMVLIGWLRGALAYFTVIVSMVLAGTTGSSAAESAAVGSIFIPNLIKRGYGRAFSVALVACSSVIGIIIPPSVFMIIYGSYGNVSVIALFVGGILPGAAIGLGLMGVSYFYAKKYDYPREREKVAPIGEIAHAFKKGVWPLGVPLILIGGMIAGLFTATEASMVTVVYTLILTIVFYRTIKLRDLLPMIRDTGLGSGIPMFCLACAGVYGYLLAFYKVPEYVAELVIAWTTNPDMIMLFVISVYLVVGTFMDGTPAIIILLPITQRLGAVANLNPLHLGLVVCVTIALGLLTPPYGLCTLISCAIGKAKMTDVMRPMLPMFALMLLVVLIMAFFPSLTLFLPRLLVPDMVPLQ